jgi:cysteine-rich repeat protein
MALDDVVVTLPCTSNSECNDGAACTDDVCNLGTGVCESTDTCTGGATCNVSAGVCQVPAGQSLVDALDLDNYKLHIQNLSSLDPPINGTRYWRTAGNAAARDYIQAQLESYGYTVERHAYVYNSTNMDQVYATKSGADPSKMYIVGAHMDSTNLDSGDPDNYAPGASDDASGTSLVLEAARVFADSSVQTQVSIRFILWNNEETGLNGSGAYVSSRRALQGIENPPGSGIYPEPSWLGVVQHDMMMWDHGPGPLPADPPWPPQPLNADVDIEYQASSAASAASAALASQFLSANSTFATDYPAEVTSNMCCTDSVRFEDDVASISLRENRRAAEIGNSSDPHWHQDSDIFETFGPEDFLLGFNALQTSVGAIAGLAGATLAGTCGDTILDPGEQCDDGNTNPGDCCSATCQFESAATVCRAAADVCDLAETCTGSSATCPADGFEPVTTECRASTGVCDIAEMCTGAGAACPADGFEPAITECRASAGVCDIAETCTGAGTACPADGFAPVTTECRASAGVCDIAEMCPGTASACPGDVVLSGVPCPDGDVCNGAEMCETGTCTSQPPLDCDDGDACTADSCDLITGCANEPIPLCGVPVPSASSGIRVMLALILLTAGGSLLLQRRQCSGI